MASTLVAIICNIITLAVIAGGVITTFRLGIKLAAIRLGLTVAGAVGAFFLTPLISTMVTSIMFDSHTLLEMFNSMGVSLYTINSILFALVFLILYLVTSLVFSFIQHIFIQKLTGKFDRQNNARLKRAKSINPKAERKAKREEYRNMRSTYRSHFSWWKKLISGALGGVSTLLIAIVLLIGFNAISTDLVAQDSETNQYLLDGYQYTLNGFVEDTFDIEMGKWVVGVISESPEVSE